MGVDVVFGGGDLADKNGCIYGPQAFHDHLLPHLQQFGKICQEVGMDLGQVRERFPKLTMWGGVACGPTLRNATPQQVKGEALRSMQVASSGGGLILGSSNTIMHGTPPENVWAMLEARDEFNVSTI